MPDFTYQGVAKMIDHSLLQPNLTDADLEQGCRSREVERVVLTTDEPLDHGLYDYLARRSQHY